MLGLRKLINRLRHNRGYGVQSPAAFFFVTHVLRESLPYYHYPIINKAATKQGCSASHCRRLFRIANHIKPQNIIAVGNEQAIINAICKACPNTPCHILDKDKTKKLEFEDILTEEKEIGLLYIGKSQEYNNILQKVLSHINKNSVIIVEGIRKSTKEKKEWSETIALPQVIISMDLYNYGILFFNPQYKKQHYTFLFK